MPCSSTAGTPTARAALVAGTCRCLPGRCSRRPGRSGSATGRRGPRGPHLAPRGRRGRRPGCRRTSRTCPPACSCLHCHCPRHRSSLDRFLRNSLQPPDPMTREAASPRQATLRPAREIGTSRTRIPCDVLRQRTAQPLDLEDPLVRRPRRRAELARGRPRGVCRRPARRTGVRGSPPCSRVEKIAPPSSLATTIVRSGRGSSGPMHQAVRVVQEGQVADVGQRSRRPAAERGADGRRHRAVDAGQATVAERPAGARPAGRSRAIRSRSRTGCEEPTTSSPRATDRVGRPRPRPAAAGPPAWPRGRRPPAASSVVGSTPGIHPVVVVRRLARVGIASRWRATRPGSVQTAAAAAHRDHLDVRARDQPRHRPRQRRVAGDDDPLDLRGRARRASSSRDVRRACVPVRAPGRGLGEQRPVAVLGQEPRRRARRRRPATTTVRGPLGKVSRLRAGSSAASREPRSCSSAQARPPGRSSSGPGVGQQRLGELQVDVRRTSTAYGRCDRVAGRDAASGARSSTQGTVGPNMPGLRRSSGWHRCRAARRVGPPTARGRGSPACDASSTAGCRLATAVPEVVTTAAGRCAPLARPSARKPAVRSSIRTCSRSSPAASASCSASARAAEREPGASTTSRTPPRRNAATTAMAERGRGVHDASILQRRRRRRRAGPATGPRRPGRHAPRCQRVGVRDWTRRTGEHARRPDSAARPTTSHREHRRRRQPARVRQLGQRGGQGDSGGDADRRLQADETTTGMPSCSASRRQARTPPSGCTLSTAMSAAPSALHREGIGRRVGSTRRPRSGRRRVAGPRASSSTLAHRLLDVLEVEARPARRSPRRPRSTVQPPFASTRTRPSAPECIADGADPGDVVVEGLARLGHLDLGRPAAVRSR